MAKQDPFLSRVRCGYSETSPSGYPYRVDEGGTTAFDRFNALDNLESISSDSIGDPNSVLPLDKYRLPLDEDLYSAQVSQSDFVDGDINVSAGEIAEFIITNYTYTYSYTVTVIGNGSVELSQDKIIYRAPITFTEGGDGFTIEGRDVLINVIGTANHAVTIPTILFPINNSSNVTINPTLVSSNFTYTGYPEVHLTSSWELALDASFDTLVHSSYDDIENKTSWTPGELLFDTPYYVRVKHTGGLSGTTDWSSISHFTTRAESGVIPGDNYVDPPMVISETNIDGILVPDKYVSVFTPSIIQYQADLIDVPLDPILESTPFGCDGSLATEETIVKHYKVTLNNFSYTGLTQSYVSTIWEVSTEADFSTLVLRTTNNTQYKKELVLPSLTADTTYYVRAKYVGNLTGESDWSDMFQFDTEVPYIKSDVTVLDGDPNRYNIDPLGSISYEFGSSVVVSDNGGVLCVAQRDRHMAGIITNPVNVSLVQQLGGETQARSLLSLGNGIVLAGTYPTGQIYRSTDNGLSFTLVQRLGGESNVISLLSLGNGIVLAGTVPTGQIYRSTDNGLSFTLVQRLGFESYVWSLLSLGNGIVLAGTYPTGQIYRSTDNGLSFTLVQRLGSESWVFSLLSLENGIVLAGTTTTGQIYRSTDNGLSFSLVQRLGSESYVASLLSLGNGIVLAGTLPTGQIYRSTDNGLSFTLVQQLGSELYVLSLLSLGNGIVLAGTYPTGQIYRSTDNGLSFSLVQRLGSEIWVFSLLSLGNGIVLAGTGGVSGHVYKITGLVDETVYKPHAGSVSIFNRMNNDWVYSLSETLSGDEESIYFGDDVSVNNEGQILAITAPGKPVVDACNGAVYVINKTDEFPIVTLTAAGQADILHFADSVSLNNTGNKLAIGNRSKDQWDNTTNTIQLWEFSADTWSLVDTIVIDQSSNPSVKTNVKISSDGERIYTVRPSSGYYFIEYKKDINNYWDPSRIYYNLPDSSTLHNISLAVSKDENFIAIGIIVFYDSTLGQTYKGSTDVYRGYVNILKKHTNVDLSTIWYKHSTIDCSDFEYLPRFGFKVNLNSDGTHCAITGQYLDPNDSTKVNAIFVYKLTDGIYQQYYRIANIDGRIGDDTAFAFDDSSIVYVSDNNYKVQTLRLLKSSYQTHIESRWELSKANDFSTVDYFTINKTQALIWDTPQLDYDTTYYVRLKQTGNITGESDWSIVKSFDTIRYVPPINAETRILHPLYSGLDYDQTYTDPVNYHYGMDLSLDGNGGILVVGCPNKSTFFNTESGAIYVYKGFSTAFNPTENIITTLIEPNKDNITNLGNQGKNWSGICKLGNHTYACVSGGDIYKQTNGTGNFVALNQTNRVWSGICSNNVDVYACVSGGDIYKQTNGAGNFVALNQTSRSWSGLTLYNNDIYATVNNGKIYKQTNSAGNFVSVNDLTLQWSDICVCNNHVYSCVENGDVYKMTITDPPNDNTLTALNQTSRAWYCLAVHDDDVYACVYEWHGDIYKQTNGVGDFVALNQIRPWSAICFLNNDMYACTLGGDIYKQTNMAGNFVALGQTNRSWSGLIAFHSDVYACVSSGDIYKQTNGTGNFVALNQTTRSWNGMCVFGNDVYACSTNDGIYKQTDGVGDFNLISGTNRNWTGICGLGSDIFGCGFGQDIYRLIDTAAPYISTGQTVRQYRGIVNYKNTLYIAVHGGDIYKMSFRLNNFETMGQISRNYYGITARNQDLYACVYNGDIYKQTNNTGDFLLLNQTARTWTSITSNGTDVYACVISGDIYKQTNGVGDFVALSQTARSWFGLIARGMDIYACVSGGDIYKQTDGTGDFVALNQTSRNWTGLATLSNDIYACVSGGDIYKQTNGTGNFVALNQTSRNWSGMTCSVDNVYASVDSGDVYVQIKGIGDFRPLSQSVKSWKGMAFLNGVMYIAVQNASIYKLLEFKYIYTLLPYSRLGSLKSMCSNGVDIYATSLDTGDIYTLNTTTNVFVRLNQTSRSYYSLTSSGTNVYACVSGGDIYKQTNGTGDFVALNQTSRNWTGLATLSNDIYACVSGGDIYKQTNGTGNFVALNQVNRAWYGLCSNSNDVYAYVYGGDIYKQTNGVGDFVALNQTSRNWIGMTSLGSDVYACVTGGDIYKQTNGTGNFVALGQYVRGWYGMFSDGTYTYAYMSSGNIYKGIDIIVNPTVDLNPLGLTTNNWASMAGANTDVYLTTNSYTDTVFKLDTLGIVLSSVGNNPKNITASYGDNNLIYFGEKNGDIYRVNSSITDSQHFGSAVCIDNNVENIAVGSPNLNIGATISAGAVYVYHFNIVAWPDIGEWVKIHTIEPTAPVENQMFGSSVTFGPLTNIAIGQNTDLGKVTIYVTDNNLWTVSQTLQGDHETYTGLTDGFGNYPGTIAFANTGDRLFISAKLTNVSGNSDTGVVYIYKHNGSSYIQETILESPAVINTYFGQSISCTDDGTKLLVGCPGANKAYLYEYDNNLSQWGTPIEFVRDGDLLDNDYFGTNVAINGLGTKLYIYAHNGDLLDNCVCNEYGYINNTWTYMSQYKPNEMTGVPSDPSFPLQWNNKIACSSDPDISDHLFVGFPKQTVLGYLEVGNVTQFK